MRDCRASAGALRALLAAALLAPLLWGCGGFSPFGASRRVPPGEDTPAHEACRREARLAPEVRVLDRQANPVNQASERRLDRERQIAEARAYRDCLYRAGLTPAGGVEPVIPR
jgi:hypothetical protein